MKRILSVIVLLVMVAGNCFAATTSTQSPLTRYAGTVVTETDTDLRTLTTDTRTGAPWTPTVNSGLNCKNWRKALLFVSCRGAGVGATIVPGYGVLTKDTATMNYYYGTGRTVSSDTVLVVDTYGTTDFNVKVSEIVGTSSKVDVYCLPVTD